jgi:ABC-2 type transport system permease protein
VIYAVLKTMGLRLWRDKGALVLAFVLPGVIFAIFAAIFSTASGGSLDLRVAFAAVGDDPAVIAITETLRDETTFDIVENESWSGEDVKEQVKLGQADVGLLISPQSAALPLMTIVEDPSRKVAATVVKGQIRQILADKSGTGQDIFATISALPVTSNVAGPPDKSVTYYIGATAILFLMFAAMQGASISIDERRSGISERLMVGPSGALAMLTGKFLFLTLIGVLQAIVIIAVANLFFGVRILPFLEGLVVASLGTAMLAAGLALFTAALCATQTQMHTISTFLVLLFSAVGGSMVPRFMMPGWLQSLGIATPNYWVIEAYYGLLARGQSVLSLWPVWSVIFISAFVLLGLSAILSHKLMRV